jgi:hypothetical protein
MSAVAVQRDVDDLVLQLKGLVHVRALLETRGVSVEEIDAHSNEIARVRAELANRVKDSDLLTAA